MIEKIYKIAELESQWIKHYGYIDSRLEEKFEDILFYDRMYPIGYSKRYTPLHLRCPMGYVNTLTMETVTEICYGPRNHEKGIYTCLEFVIYNKISGYLQLIENIKK